MGQADQFGKRTLAEETPRVTRGAVTWQDPPEIGLLSVQGDGYLLVHDPQVLASLEPPWSLAQAHDEVPVELKMPGDHLDMVAVERTLLRRQARQVQRMEQSNPPWRGQVPQWLVAPHVPPWLHQERRLKRAAQGCFRVEPAWFELLWIAANELPLRDELVPFLIARSGRALDEFLHWVRSRRPVEWLLDMVRYTPMSTTLREEWMRRFAPTDDPELEARTEEMLQTLLRQRPAFEQKLLEKARLDEARAALRSVLAWRCLPLTADAEARIDGCHDLTTLQRWHKQALTAASAAEALT